jgi:hypothetical protein
MLTKRAAAIATRYVAAARPFSTGLMTLYNSSCLETLQSPY